MKQISIRKVDMGLGIFCAVVGIFILYRSSKLDFTIGNAPGPGFFPGLSAAALALVGGLLALISRASSKGDDAFAMPSLGQAKRSIGLWLVLLASVLMFSVVGFLISMLGLVGVLIFGLEGKRNLAGVATVVLIPLGAYLLFGVLLQVRLPTGVFGI